MAAEHAKAEGLKKEHFAAPMQRLLDAGAIRNESFGPPSRKVS